MNKSKYIILIFVLYSILFTCFKLYCSELKLKADLFLEFNDFDLYKFIDPDDYDISTEMFFVEKVDSDTLIGIYFSSNKRVQDKKYYIHFINKKKQLCKTLFAKDFFSVFVYEQKSYILNKDLQIESILYKDTNRDIFVESMRNRISNIINKNINNIDNYKSINDITNDLFPNYFLLCNNNALSFIDKNNLYYYDYKKNVTKVIDDAKIGNVSLTSELVFSSRYFPTIIKEKLIYYQIESNEIVLIDLYTNKVIRYHLNQIIPDEFYNGSKLLDTTIMINLYAYNEQLYLRIVDYYKSYVYKIFLPNL